MKKYKTFGELLAFIREHLDECEREEVNFAVVRSNSSDGTWYRTAFRLVNTIYSPSILNGLVVYVEEIDKESAVHRLIIKVLI